MALSSERRAEVLNKVREQMETAGHGGFAIMVFFDQPTGIFNKRRGRPVGLRKRTNFVRFTRTTGIVLEEVRELKDTLSEDELEVVIAAAEKWRKTMNAFWQRETERMQAEAATV